MTSIVSYELAESADAVATITLDDGKVNVLGPGMQSAINGSGRDRRRQGGRAGG